MNDFLNRMFFKKAGTLETIHPLELNGHFIPSIQIDAAKKIDDLITPVELGKISPNCTISPANTRQALKMPPYAGLFSKRTPIAGGLGVGGIGLEPTTSSV